MGNKISSKRKSAVIVTPICMVILAILFILLITNFVSAEFWACFTKGEVVHYCSNYKPDWTCNSNNGCQKCMSVYNETQDCYVHGVWNKCNQLPPGCTVFGNGSIDAESPIITLNNPTQDGIYNKRAVLLDLKVDEKSDLYYYDNIYGRGRWKRICNDCFDYNNSRSFKEGLNDITFRATDSVGNTAYVNVTFFVDYKDPIIKKTEPKRNKFFNGNFWVQYYELNLKEVKLFYGNSGTGYNDVILGGCESGKKEECDIDVDLSSYDGQDIEYWFVIRDIANNTDDSKPVWGEVDITPPVINWLNHEINKRYVTFNISITEENFDEVSYYDASETRPRWKRLCSRLKDGICLTRKSFRYGEHNLTIQVTDEAGNSVGQNINFVINY